jgi:RimJ/RimL family protein N-acetyltransferase
MKYIDESIHLRRIEEKDIDELYLYKNDETIMELLGGFSAGYSRSDIREWIEFHRKKKDELLWIIADCEKDRCLGHVGLYHIDYRIRSAEFAILLGDKNVWRKGIGEKATRYIVDYGFSMLNLNRISLTVLEENNTARKLYRKVGFKEEGILRHAQYKKGKYLNVVLMSLLREEFYAGCN